MKKKNALTAILGAVLIASGLVMSVATRNPGPESMILINAGMAMAVMALVRHIRYGKGVEADEMTKRIAYISLAASFQITLFFLITFWWISYVFPGFFTTSQFAGIMFIEMIVANVLFRIYYSRRTERL